MTHIPPKHREAKVLRIADAAVTKRRNRLRRIYLEIAKEVKVELRAAGLPPLRKDGRGWKEAWLLAWSRVEQMAAMPPLEAIIP